MTVGSDTFIYSMLEEAGFESLLQKTRYPEITLQEIKNLQPDFLFLSNEPFPFKEKDKNEIQVHLPKTKVIIVDATYFSWYGSRIMNSFNYFKKLQTQIANMS